ncbi:MAG: DUF3783 domain-containing protein [Megasphaera sp.]|jgi:hypothetical protein|nr:DUF3783 domain-containing protein [Megasphaera sp.]MCI1247856.1 DUF3783 domain-containing protein [Megasphaera sp.]
MAFKMILAVNFTADRLQQLKLLGLLTKASVKAVAENEKTEKVGTLLGLTAEEVEEIASIKKQTADDKVHDKVDEDEQSQPVTKEAIVLCGFDKTSLNLLLDSIRRGKLKNVPLKAMITPNNISWSIQTILQELNKEHEYFKKMKQGKK